MKNHQFAFCVSFFFYLEMILLFFFFAFFMCELHETNAFASSETWVGFDSALPSLNRGSNLIIFRKNFRQWSSTILLEIKKEKQIEKNKKIWEKTNYQNQFWSHFRCWGSFFFSRFFFIFFNWFMKLKFFYLETNNINRILIIKKSFSSEDLK